MSEPSDLRLTKGAQFAGMQALMKAIQFIRDAKHAEPGADKAALQRRYVEAFSPEVVRKVFVGNGYALRFSKVGGRGFTGTVLALSALQKHDECPFVVVVVRPDRVEFLLSNSTLLRKISHSSRDLRFDNIVGSFNGTDILGNSEGVPNDPAHFPELFAIHEAISWEGNLDRLAETTNGIAPRKQPFAPTAVQRELLSMAPERARLALATPGFAALEAEFQRRAVERLDEILVAAKQENGKLRGEMIERLLVDGPGSHALGDYEALVDGFHLAVDIKTKLFDGIQRPRPTTSTKL